MLRGDERSYFFRAHKSCWSGIGDDEKTALESSLIDPVAEALEASLRDDE